MPDLRDDVAALDLTGADGIGLFRTEFQFLVSATMPAREQPAAAVQATCWMPPATAR